MTAPTHVLLEGTDLEICRWIWKHLVPRQGQASTVQGELLRAIARLQTEAQDNGNVNWDAGFVRFVDYLERILTAEPGFSDAVKLSIRTDLKRLRVDDFAEEDVELDEENSPYLEDDLYERISGHIVAWCRLHPAILPREHDPDLDR